MSREDRKTNEPRLRYHRIKRREKEAIFWPSVLPSFRPSVSPAFRVPTDHAFISSYKIDGLSPAAAAADKENLKRRAAMRPVRPTRPQWHSAY